LEHHIATAVEACFSLMAVPKLTLRFAVADDLRLSNSAELMVPEQFLAYARESGLAELSDRLESEAKRGERTAMRRGDRKAEPAGRPLLFPAILRASDIGVFRQMRTLVW